MPRFRSLLLATAIAATPFAVSAQPVTGLYIAGGAGLNVLQDTDTNLPRDVAAAAIAAGLPNSAETRFSNGFVGLGSIGYGFGNGLRVEIEGSYRHNDFRGARVAGLNSRNNDGEVRQIAGMANVFYDFAFRGIGVYPYLGVGVGYAHVSADVRGDFRPTRSQVFRTDDEDSAFAYQGIAGLSLPLTPALSFTAEYRFFGTTELELSGTQTQTISGVTTRRRGDFENFNHSALIGLRYAFNTPRPAVVAVVPPAVQAVARTYLVFFDWDRADLTDRARQIIAEAARNARGTGTTRIELAGHADRSGTPQYNQRLSQRRAEAVAAELTRQGIGRNEIAVTAFGESRPLVPTADGVREPQNRRVEIVLR